MQDRFLFDQQLEEPDDNDDVIGCVPASQRICICQSCGKDDCMYRGSLRMEVA